MNSVGRNLAARTGFDIHGLVDRVVRSPAIYGVPLKRAIAEFKQAYLEKTLELHGSNPSRAAKVLGFNRHTLSRKLRSMNKVT